MRQTDEPLPKYQQVFAALEQNIRNGHWKQGDRVPSEAQLIRQFGASRITVGRAVRDLQLAGLVERRAGAGTFVRAPADRGLSFGLLIPDLGETEIFEPICRGSPRRNSFASMPCCGGAVGTRRYQKRTAPGSFADNSSTGRWPASSSPPSRPVLRRTR